MAFSNRPTVPKEAKTHTKMDSDLDAIGAHCQMKYCGFKTLLPLKCESCRKTFCENHGSETAHRCEREGERARKLTGIDTVTTASPELSRHNPTKHCFSPGCKKPLDITRMQGVNCPECRRYYCIAHRLPEKHACPGAPHPPVIQTQRDRGLAALDRLKSWGMSKKASLPKPKLPVSDKKAAAKASVAIINSLKITAKGDAKIPMEKRIYLFVEASGKTTTAKFPTGKFFYDMDWSIGRMLDAAAKALQVQNVNNRVPGEDEKLRVYHVEGGEMLDFSSKVGDALKTGHTIVLLRGAGPPAPELITL